MSQEAERTTDNKRKSQKVTAAQMEACKNRTAGNAIELLVVCPDAYLTMHALFQSSLSQ